MVRPNPRDNDFAARLDGDEFARLIAGNRRRRGLAAVERLLTAVRSSPWNDAAETKQVMSSVGLCESASFGDSSELVRRAAESL